MILPRPEDIIRIEMLTKPAANERGEGCFEWRHLTDTMILDIIQLRSELKKLRPGREELLTDRIYNFRKMYINTKTGEVTT